MERKHLDGENILSKLNSLITFPSFQLNVTLPLWKVIEMSVKKKRRKKVKIYDASNISQTKYTLQHFLSANVTFAKPLYSVM